MSLKEKIRGTFHFDRQPANIIRFPSPHMCGLTVSHVVDDRQQNEFKSKFMLKSKLAHHYKVFL